jgi:hypothetical protein
MELREMKIEASWEHITRAPPLEVRLAAERGHLTPRVHLARRLKFQDVWFEAAAVSPEGLKARWRRIAIAS